MSELTFTDFIALQQLLLVKGADLTTLETDEDGFEVEAIWTERGRNFRALIASDVTVIESVDADFEDLTIDDTQEPSIEWIQRVVLIHSA